MADLGRQARPPACQADLLQAQLGVAAFLAKAGGRKATQSSVHALRCVGEQLKHLAVPDDSSYPPSSLDGSHPLAVATAALAEPWLRYHVRHVYALYTIEDFLLKPVVKKAIVLSLYIRHVKFLKYVLAY